MVSCMDNRLFIFIGLILITIFYGVFYKKKRNLCLSVILLLLLMILMGGNSDNIDYTIYENMYNSSFFSKDIGFGILINFSKFIGLDINSFRLMISIIGLFLIHKSLIKMANQKYAFFYLIYFIYPFLFDVVQVRNFLAMSIFIYATTFLIDNTFKNKVTYILLIVCAASIQKVALIYVLVVLIVDFKGNKKIYKYVLILIIGFSIILGLNKSLTLNFIKNIADIYSTGLIGIDNYLSVNTNYGWIISWFQQCMNFFIINKIKKIGDLPSNTMTNKQREYISLIYNINLLMFVFLPLYVLDENYTRIFRNVMPLNWIAISVVAGQKPVKSVLQTKSINKYQLIQLISILFAMLLFALMSRDYWDSIIIKIFSMNWMW